MPRLSVVLPVRNDERGIASALASLLRQTFTDFELLVVDDASTDRTRETVREAAARDSRIKLLRQDHPLGLASTLNNGLAACRAPLIARAAACARYEPTWLEREAAWLSGHPFCVLVGAWAGLTDARGELLSWVHTPTGYDQIRQAIGDRPSVVPGTMMWRRREIEAIGLFAVDPDLAGAEDLELVARVAARHRVENVGEVLCLMPAAAMEESATTSARARARALAEALFAGQPAPVIENAARIEPRASSQPGGRLFVSVAAYRDAELGPTLADLFERAARPDDIAVGVCLQYDPDVDQGASAVRTRPDQVTVLDAHVRESQGLGWARHLIERLWSGQDYVLQIDAHMRFADRWDDRLLEQLDATGSAFPVLTTYPPPYSPPRRLQHGPPPRLRAKQFTAEGILLLGATADTTPPARPVPPTPQAFFAGGFAFYRGSLLREVPTDPLMYFNATEPTHMVRVWTHGWDFFAPSENLAFHLYASEKPEQPLHWRDRPDWLVLATRGQKRARHLLGMEPTRDADALVQLDQYGLGAMRTLDDYERYAGVDFRARTISDLGRQGRVNPRFASPRPVRPE
jgi:Glycosyltransferase (GlcNAc)/Glycosyl transferase family 2